VEPGRLVAFRGLCVTPRLAVTVIGRAPAGSPVGTLQQHPHPGSADAHPCRRSGRRAVAADRLARAPVLMVPLRRVRKIFLKAVCKGLNVLSAQRQGW
jgi:hypothetical protein